MKHNYYIYIASSLTSSRYNEALYSLDREVFPAGKWSIKHGRNQDFQEVVRRDFGGELIFSGDDYKYLMGLLSAKEYRQLVIKIYKKGVEFWKGYFSIYDFKVNEDKCSVTFSPKVWDEYSRVIDEINLERNALLVIPYYTVTSSSYPYLTESLEEWSCGIAPHAPTWTQHPDGGNYWLYEAEYTPSEYCTWDEKLTYTREYQLTNDGITPPPIGGGAWAWNLIGSVSPGVYKWARAIGSGNYNTYSPGGGLIWTLDMSIPPPLFFDIDYVRARKLNDVLTYYFQQSGLTYTSHFFEDAFNPISGIEFNIFMQQASDLLSASDPATKSILKLSDILNSIKNTFNCDWYIDPAGEARIENRMYFSLGESYTVPMTIGLDLTLPAYTEYIKHHQYEFKQDFVRFEQWDFLYANNTDFVGVPIRYPQNCITNSDTKKRSPIWATDLGWILDHKEDVSKTGWNLIHSHFDGVNNLVLFEVGKLSNSIQPNGHLSTANLLYYYWGYGRQLEQGYVNNILTDFYFTENIKFQVSFNIPICDDDINFHKYVMTDYGPGKLESAEYDPVSEMYMITLSYE